MVFCSNEMMENYICLYYFKSTFLFLCPGCFYIGEQNCEEMHIILSLEKLLDVLDGFPGVRSNLSY